MIDADSTNVSECFSTNQLNFVDCRTHKYIISTMPFALWIRGDGNLMPYASKVTNRPANARLNIEFGACCVSEPHTGTRARHVKCAISN